MARRPWTRAEVIRAIELSRSGKKAAAIGKRLGRTRSAVSLKLWKHGVRTTRRQGELMAAVRRHKGLFDWEVALILNVSVSAVGAARRRAKVPATGAAQAARANRRWHP